MWGCLIEGFSVGGKRIHIVIAALCQIVFSAVMITLGNDTPAIDFTLVAMGVMCGKAWMTPAIEALMVNQMKLDLERGAEDLETFGFFCRTLGSIIFAILGGFLIGYYEHPHPKLYFVISGGMGILIMVSALIYPKSSEEVHVHTE